MRGRPFQSGNKMGRGRPYGSRNKRTQFAEAMEENGLAVIKQCQLQALKGDSTALRLCLERLLPACKPSTPRFRLPPVRTAADLAEAIPAILQAVARGQLSAAEGAAITGMLESQRRALEMEEVDNRLRALEQAQANAGAPFEQATSSVGDHPNTAEETSWLEPDNHEQTSNTGGERP